jgi:hypothetical protein
MIIWVTRRSASSIMFGGLERLNVHFSKPVWLIEPLNERDRDIPFGCRYDESRGFYKTYGWTNEHNSLPTLSVGKWLGYSEDDNPEKELTIFIWEKLREHFLYEDFLNWEDVEKQGRCKIEDFLLEIEISLSICSNPKSNAAAPSY